jgi:hypothetical protein
VPEHAAAATATIAEPLARGVYVVEKLPSVADVSGLVANVPPAPESFSVTCAPATGNPLASRTTPDTENGCPATPPGPVFSRIVAGTPSVVVAVDEAPPAGSHTCSVIWSQSLISERGIDASTSVLVQLSIWMVLASPPASRLFPTLTVVESGWVTVRRRYGVFVVTGNGRNELGNWLWRDEITIRRFGPLSERRSGLATVTAPDQVGTHPQEASEKYGAARASDVAPGWVTRKGTKGVAKPEADDGSQTSATSIE